MDEVREPRNGVPGLLAMPPVLYVMQVLAAKPTGSKSR